MSSFKFFGSFLSDPFVVPILFGPTCCGKSQLSLDFCCSDVGKNFEIINIDSAQIFYPLRVGVASPPPDSFSLAPHHLYGFFSSPDSLSSFFMRQIIEFKCLEIFSHGRRPIIVGGSHFYIYSLFFSPSSHFLLFSPRFSYSLFFMNIDFDDRYTKKIYGRASSFFSDDKILLELSSLSKSWLDFVLKKKFIAYDSALSVLSGSLSSSDAIELIKNDTMRYARKQLLFVKKIKREIAFAHKVPWYEITI